MVCFCQLYLVCTWHTLLHIFLLICLVKGNKLGLLTHFSNHFCFRYSEVSFIIVIGILKSELSYLFMAFFSIFIFLIIRLFMVVESKVFWCVLKLQLYEVELWLNFISWCRSLYLVVDCCRYLTLPLSPLTAVSSLCTVCDISVSCNLASILDPHLCHQVVWVGCLGSLLWVMKIKQQTSA